MCAHVLRQSYSVCVCVCVCVCVVEAERLSNHLESFVSVPHTDYSHDSDVSLSLIV